MYKQLKDFNLSKMGKKKGYCLQNVRLGYGIPAKNEDAKADMLENTKRFALHSMEFLPTNVVVPVYVNTQNIHKHIIVSYYGQLYSDGEKINRNYYKDYFGWGEYVNGVKVVERIGDDEKMYKYCNGSSPEEVFADTDLSIRIGVLDAGEECECLGVYKNRAIVRYNVNNTTNFKIGFVKWTGRRKKCLLNIYGKKGIV